MGFADFFFGKKTQNTPSLNDLIRFQNRSRVDVTGPGFDIFTGAEDGRPFTRITEEPAIRETRLARQGAAAGLSPRIEGLLAGQDFSPIQADTAAADRVERALFERGFDLLEPIRERRRERVEQRAADQGLVRGGAARAELFDELAGIEESEIGDLLTRALLGREQALSADIGRQVTARGAGEASINNFLNQINALLAPAPGTPGFGPTGPLLSGGDILAPSAQQAQLDLTRGRQRSELLSGALQGLTSLGTGFIPTG